MFESNVAATLARLRPEDLVLDVGGWARPFNRANYVLDSGPYETRNLWYRDHFGWMPQGGDVERFTRETWIQRDICDREPWPFADKQFDYCICSHTLEDIRDPIGVCSEMVRVAKAGYIEVPSRLSEQCRGHEPGIVGISHHRWLIEVEGAGLRFTPKIHSIHGDYRRSLPPSFRAKLTPEQSVTWLFWEGSFPFGEVSIHHGDDATKVELTDFNADLADFVRRHHSYGPARAALESARVMAAKVVRLPGRATRKIARLVNSGGKA